ncbi:MAG: TadE/TadG family type IV pilus assembly protein [Planctomycetota bacterium]|jgi:hypothetical protein
MLRKSKKTRYRGITFVETALVLPLVLLLVFALMEYGWAFYKMHLISNAARVGARIAVRPNVDYNLDVGDAINDLMTQADISDYSFACYYYDTAITNLNNVPVGDPIELRLTVTVNQDISIFRFREAFLPLPEQLQASVTMSKEGPN